MKSFALVAAFCTTALAGPVEPDSLPLLNPKPTGKGAPTTLYATGVPIDHLLRLLFPDGPFLLIADAATFEGRIPQPVPLEAAIGAIGATNKLVVPGAGSAATIDVDFYRAPVQDLMRLFADTVRADLIWAPSKPPPTVSLRLKRVDARTTARAMIKLVGLELIEKGPTWIVVDKGTTLDPKLMARTADASTRLRIRAGTPGEITRLIDPQATAGTCPTDRTIDVSMRGGRIGPVLAVAATIAGAACSIAPPDTAPKTGTLVGILSGTKERRAVFRHAKGTLVVTPGTGDVIGDGYVTLGTETIPLYPALSTAPPTSLAVEDTTPCGADAAKRGYTLRATAKIGSAWRAMLMPKDGMPFLLTEKSKTGKATITAGRVICEKGGTYQLTAP